MCRRYAHAWRVHECVCPDAHVVCCMFLCARAQVLGSMECVPVHNDTMVCFTERTDANLHLLATCHYRAGHYSQAYVNSDMWSCAHSCSKDNVLAAKDNVLATKDNVLTMWSSCMYTFVHVHIRAYVRLYTHHVTHMRLQVFNPQRPSKRRLPISLCTMLCETQKVRQHKCTWMLCRRSCCVYHI